MALLTVLEIRKRIRAERFPQTFGPCPAIPADRAGGHMLITVRALSAAPFVALQHGASGGFRKRLLEICDTNNAGLLPGRHSWPTLPRPLCCHAVSADSGKGLKTRAEDGP
ncbi:hypothetical protein [Azospirillum thiophilum]|uniref:hypothetical protein n=1 Tax=Azospirillum thiophilum TaxID=528244 RepID=UPI0011875775|nr:hypothetical protein [Azospirillum thiophilum]